MHSLLSLLLTLLPLSLAQPQWPNWSQPQPSTPSCTTPTPTPTCIPPSIATPLVSTLESFYVAINTTLALQTLTAGFQQRSYSGMRPGPGGIPVSGILLCV
jgi:hypothetical protein